MGQERSECVSVVVPVYMGQAYLRKLLGRVQAAVQGVFADYELILVNDASPDASWPLICELCRDEPRVKGINLSRNFGQHYAITAGLSYVSGDWVVVMDCDLQDAPEEIPNLYRKAQEGFDSVFAQRVSRQDTLIKRAQSRIFYRVFSYLTDTRMDPSIANFGIYRRSVTDAILRMGDRVRYFPTMSQWVGFRKTTLAVRHCAREGGRSAYSLRKLLALATDNMIAFSDKPLRICVKTGFLMAFVAASVTLFYLARYMTEQIRVPGYSSMILSLWFIGGILLTSVGVVGIYIGRIFDQVKQRPTFLVADKVNL